MVPVHRWATVVVIDQTDADLIITAAHLGPGIEDYQRTNATVLRNRSSLGGARFTSRRECAAS